MRKYFSQFPWKCQFSFESISIIGTVWRRIIWRRQWPTCHSRWIKIKLWTKIFQQIHQLFGLHNILACYISTPYQSWIGTQNRAILTNFLHIHSMKKSRHTLLGIKSSLSITNSVFLRNHLESAGFKYLQTLESASYRARHWYQVSK